MVAPKPNSGILDIVAYKPGKSKVQSGVTLHKLSANESGLGPSPKAMAAYLEEVSQLHIYPNPSSGPLREALAARYGLEADNIICGAGSDEILQLLAAAYLSPGDSIVQSKHGFAVYKIIAEANGAKVIFAEEENLHTSVKNIIAATDDTTRIVFVANPNNPTGTCVPEEDIRALRDGLRDDILLVLDSAYAEYVEWDAYEDGISMVREAIATSADNVVMTRTFSKMYGLGGLRVGWAYMPPAILDVLNRIRGPFNVSSAAIAAGAAAVGDEEFVEKNLAHNREERARLLQEIAGIGFEVTPSFGNFLLIKMRGASLEERIQDATEMLVFLEERGVFVRGVKEYFLSDYVRISIGARASNDAMLKVLQDYTSNKAA